MVIWMRTISVQGTISRLGRSGVFLKLCRWTSQRPRFTPEVTFRPHKSKTNDMIVHIMTCSLSHLKRVRHNRSLSRVLLMLNLPFIDPQSRQKIHGKKLQVSSESPVILWWCFVLTSTMRSAIPSTVVPETVGIVRSTIWYSWNGRIQNDMWWTIL